MGQSNAWAEFAALFRATSAGHLDHEKAKAAEDPDAGGDQGGDRPRGPRQTIAGGRGQLSKCFPSKGRMQSIE
jgi:hypothetical protein